MFYGLLQNQVKNDLASVSLQLENVFTGKRIRLFEIECNALVDDIAVIGYVVSIVGAELRAFETWRNNREEAS